MKIERSLRSVLCTHFQQRSDEAMQHRRRLVIALGAGTLTGGLAAELSGSSTAHDRRSACRGNAGSSA